MSKDKKYIDHFTKDYSPSSSRFFITTPYPLVDGQYEVTISAKDKAGNTASYPVFYLKVGSSSIISSVTSFVSDLFGNKKQNNKQEITPTISSSPTNTPPLLNTGKQQPTTKSQSIFSWVANLFKSIFHK